MQQENNFDLGEIRKTRKYPIPNIGDIFGDFIIKNITRVKYRDLRCRVKCTKCSRERELPLIVLYNGKKNKSHEMCSRQVISKCSKRFHKIWLAIRYRTANPHDYHYNLYGGRGIDSDAFRFFVDFYDTMYESYKESAKKYGEKNISIDRIDVNGNYCPENCRWTTVLVQANNTRRNRKFKAFTPDGEVIEASSQSMFAREHNIPLSWIKHSLRDKVTRNGWKFEYIDPPYMKTVV